MKVRSNVAPGLLGKRVRHIECPNGARSLQEGIITGSFVEEGNLTLIVLTDSGSIEDWSGLFVTVLPQ